MTLSLDKKLAVIILPIVLFVALVLIIFAIASNNTSQDTRGFAQENVTTKSAKNFGPAIQNVPPADVNVGEEYSYTLVVTDPDNSVDEVTAKLSTAPDWMTIDGFRIYGTPTITDITTGLGSRVIVDISDGSNTVSKSFYVSVLANE